MADRPKIIFLVTEDWYFYSHRLPMARAAARAGYDVAVATNIDQHREKIEAENIRVIPLSLNRRSLNPFAALACLFKLRRLYRTEQPQLVHHIAMKPVLLGAIAAWMAGVPRVINAFAGLGYLFTADTKKAVWLRSALVPVFRILLRRQGSLLLLQNADDRDLLARLNMTPPDETHIIRGSGVELADYTVRPLPGDGFICAFAGRMIDIKGLSTLQTAFSRLANTHPHIRLWLCGRPDPANPGSWSEARLQSWAAADNVEYKGQCDMRDVWGQVHAAVQPSWGGEGIPKSLLEAAACGRAIVATDVPGCREVVHDGRNGYLVPPRDADALAEAIARLADDPAQLATMGSESRKIVESDLSAEQVGAQAESLYRRCLPA